VSKNELNQECTELLGVLQAISVVAKKLAHRLMSIQEKVVAREESEMKEK
jgi:hypothetical protein